MGFPMFWLTFKVLRSMYLTANFTSYCEKFLPHKRNTNLKFSDHDPIQKSRY